MKIANFWQVCQHCQGEKKCSCQECTTIKGGGRSAYRKWKQPCRKCGGAGGSYLIVKK